jgi:2-keto-4-pentenoate hydratase/2-oxohepta-3-ene-1,7-dioic acid hydratase in catechol pathway
VSEREYQIERGGTWDKGKGCDTFGPVGPWLVTTDEIKDPQKLDMWLDLNGKRFQTGNTKTMIFDAATIISYVSEFTTLMPGDIITTGTPPGVGMGVKPKPRFLKAGDVMVQRGTVHNWINRGTEACVLAVILIHANPVVAGGKVLTAFN